MWSHLVKFHFVNAHSQNLLGKGWGKWTLLNYLYNETMIMNLINTFFALRLFIESRFLVKSLQYKN